MPEENHDGHFWWLCIASAAGDLFYTITAFYVYIPYRPVNEQETLVERILNFHCARHFGILIIIVAQWHRKSKSFGR